VAIKESESHMEAERGVDNVSKDTDTVETASVGVGED
jgi:hypothetical protein